MHSQYGASRSSDEHVPCPSQSRSNLHHAMRCLVTKPAARYINLLLALSYNFLIPYPEYLRRVETRKEDSHGVLQIYHPADRWSVLSCCCLQKHTDQPSMIVVSRLLVQSKKPSELVNVFVKELVAHCMFGGVESKQRTEDVTSGSKCGEKITST